MQPARALDGCFLYALGRIRRAVRCLGDWEASDGLPEAVAGLAAL